MRRSWVVLFVALFTLGVGQTEVFSQGTELALFEEIPMVVLPTRVAQPITEAPAAITVITADEIAKSGYLNVWDLLRSQPGVHVSQVSGTAVNVSIRGFSSKHSSNKLAVYVDGRSVFNPTTQGTWWQTLPIMIEDIERIEIMRGPNAVMYGFNAVNGIISITTKDPAKTKGVLLKASFGTNHTQQYFARVGESIGNLDYRLSYQKDNTQGLGDDNGREYLDASRMKAVNLSTKYTLSDDKTIDFLAGTKQGHRGSVPVIGADEAHLDSDYQIARYNQTLSEDSDLKLQFTRTRWNRNRDILADSNDFGYTQYDFEFQHTFKPLQDHSLVWGGNWRRNEVWSTNFMNANAEPYHDTILRAFAQDKISLTDKLTYYCGVEWEENKYTGSDWSLRQTAMYNLLDDHFLRATFARAYHSHSFVEYVFSMTIPPGMAGVPGVVAISGNPNLERESLTAYELGYRGSFLEKKLLLDTEIFYYNLDHLLWSNWTTAFPFGPGVPFGGAVTFGNANRAQVRGFEVALDYKPYSWLKTYANYSYLQIEDKFNQWDTVDPKHMVKCGATVYMEKTYLPDYADIRLSWIDGLKTTDSDRWPFEIQPTNIFGVPLSGAYPKDKISDYLKLDIKLAKKFCDDAMEIALIGLNLWDADHWEWGQSGTFDSDGFFGPILPGQREQVDRQFIVTVKYEF